MFGGILTAALVLRIAAISGGPLSGDEAESAINALTILESGYPSSEYLGIPIYENMLLREWPDHPEYEFKDISYSDRGVAVYHGWLPLAAIAASFAAFDVHPPSREPGWTIQHDESAWKRRTLAARLPSLLFAGAFLLLMYEGGRLVGEDAGLSALVLVGLSVSIVDETIQARYHSLQLALTAAAGLTLWRLARRDRWRDHVWHAGVLVLLFYTSVLGCLAVVLATVFTVLVVRRTRSAFVYLTCSGGIVLLSILPWLLFTGYLGHLAAIPPGRVLLEFPGDLWLYVSGRPPYFVAYCVGLTWFALVVTSFGHVLPRWVTEPWNRHAGQYVVLVAWMLFGILIYFSLMPAASLFQNRLSLLLFVPGFWLLALLFTDASRVIAPPRAWWLAPVLAAGFLLGNNLLRGPVLIGGSYARLAAVFETVNQLHLKPDARVYAAPNSQLVFAFYGERPFQSIAPIRKSFLDQYPGEIVYIETRYLHEFARPDAAALKRTASRRGERLPDEVADAWARRLESRYVTENLGLRVATIVPAREPLPPFVEDAMMELTSVINRRTEEVFRGIDHTPIFRGFPLRSIADWWQVFFYRLVDPATRMGTGFNAAARLAPGIAYVNSRAAAVIFYSPTPVDVRR